MKLDSGTGALTGGEDLDRPLSKDSLISSAAAEGSNASVDFGCVGYLYFARKRLCSAMSRKVSAGI